jgi:hypothetical protein
MQVQGKVGAEQTERNNLSMAWGRKRNANRDDATGKNIQFLYLCIRNISFDEMRYKI